MKINESLNLYSNLYKSFEIYSNSYVNRIDKMMKNVLAIESIAMKYDRMFNSGIANINKAIVVADSFQNKYLDIMTGIGVTLENIQKNHITQINSIIQNWESTVNMMSSNFLEKYNNILKASIDNLYSGIIGMSQNILNLYSIESIDIDNLIAKLGNIEEFEFDEELEYEVDLQEVQAIVNSKVEDVKVSCKGENCNIAIAINSLTEELKKSNAKGSIKDNVISTILSNIIWGLICYAIGFMINFTTSSTPANTNSNHIIKTIKKEVSTVSMGNSFYSTFRIVVKDGLEVRRSNKMKSGIKYYLSFGDLVKIEHKNKNWTKISYTNAFTEEREIGWVLTRYIKRLD